jgi:hypothetical protein
MFLDDIVVYSRSLEEHDTKLTDFLARLRKYNLKLQPEKCEFLRKEINYLGHAIAESGVKPHPAKVSAIDSVPTPTTEKQLKRFLGMAGYYRSSIPNFSRLQYKNS